MCAIYTHCLDTLLWLEKQLLYNCGRAILSLLHWWFMTVYFHGSTGIDFVMKRTFVIECKKYILIYCARLRMRLADSCQHNSFCAHWLWFLILTHSDVWNTDEPFENTPQYKREFAKTPSEIVPSFFQHVLLEQNSHWWDTCLQYFCTCNFGVNVMFNAHQCWCECNV